MYIQRGRFQMCRETDTIRTIMKILFLHVRIIICCLLIRSFVRWSSTAIGHASCRSRHKVNEWIIIIISTRFQIKYESNHRSVINKNILIFCTIYGPPYVRFVNKLWCIYVCVTLCVVLIRYLFILFDFARFSRTDLCKYTRSTNGK